MAKETLFSGKFTKMKLRATVINAMWPELIFFTLVATSEFLSPISLRTCELNDLVTPVITLVDMTTDAKLEVESQLLTVLGVALGLVISFRTSSAYER